MTSNALWNYKFLFASTFLYWSNGLRQRFSRTLRSSYYKPGFRGMFSGPVNTQKFLFSPSNTKSNLFLKNMARDNVILSFMYWNINIICIGVITIYAQFFYGNKCIKLLKNKWSVPISFIYWCVNKLIVNYIHSI